MRIDKFLKVSRILKRRSLGKEACDSSRVVVNGKPAKPSHRLSIGDVVEITFGAGILKFKVVNLKETVKKEDAPTLYEIIEG
ncbi:MAG: RNA-binding S4 domain-containing protein [Clostridia bacterium]|nr:RNA-binding S4 domain-containing protein [Clostridia bacterium]